MMAVVVSPVQSSLDEYHGYDGYGKWGGWME